MNKYVGMMIVGSCLFLNACVSSASSSENPLQQPPDETVTVLFSDSSTLQNESSYYDALLEVQRIYSSDSADTPFFMIVDASERDLIRYFNIEQFPTMLVLTGDTENLRMEGIFSKDEILAHLIQIYQLQGDVSYSFHSSLS
ncbi:hypothetical protein M3212_00655 [Alkalihalobacillus oceani]|uniref:hypothetical protein n=1 Tax=Halalkalibacter oceani TaxID=1653776 RepID=UPI00203AB7FB|nr:hypothetical protein [Halalkalibacter oceani]MCM3759286.1 hypothetical protein [Halalkalibacter oceani]